MRLEITVHVKDRDEAQLFVGACKSANVTITSPLEDAVFGADYTIKAHDAMQFYFLGIYVGLAKAQKTLETK